MGSFPHSGRLSPARSSAVALGLTVAVCAVAYVATRTTLLDDFEYRGYDLLVNVGGYSAQDARVVVVDFDDAALQQVKAFPIPRATIASAVSAVAAGGAELIGLDLLLSEARTPDEDRAMAEALRGAGNVVVASMYGSNDVLLANPLPEFCTPDPAIPSACDGQSAAFGLGMVNMPVDNDGFIRRFFLLPPEGYPVLPLPAALATEFAGQPLARGAGRSIRFGDTVLHPDRSGRNTALIGTWSRQPARVVTAAELFTPGFDSRVFNGKIVLIGQSNSAAGDRHFTPIFRATAPDGTRLMMPGTQLLAAAITTILNGRTVRVLPPAAHWTVTAAIVFVALWLLLHLRPLTATAGFVVAGLVTYLAAQGLYATAHVWMPFISTEAALSLALPTGFAYRFVVERLLKRAAEAERRQLMGIFSKYVSADVAEEIWTRRGEIVLAGQEKRVTVMFTDIRGFTRKTAGRPSMEVLHWLNDYFSAMTEVAQQHGGFVNKFIGDGIMILFGMPLTQGSREDAGNAVRAGLAVHDRFETRPLGEVEIRGLTGKISLHTVTAAGAAAVTLHT